MNRIISLCPSTTLTLFDLGLKNEIAGRTIFCNKPESKVDKIPKVGGTKNPKFEKIKSFKPSHILFNEEENDINHLSKLENIANTVIHTPVDVKSSLKMISDYGDIFGCKEKSDDWTQKIESKQSEILNKKHKHFTYLYLIWREPYMLAGNATYIDHMLSLINGENLAITISSSRYPELALDKIKKLNADFIFLSTEPYPFKEKHFDEFKNENSRIQIVDGEALSWHGTYSFFGLEYLDKLSESLRGLS